MTKYYAGICLLVGTILTMQMFGIETGFFGFFLGGAGIGGGFMGLILPNNE